jgi:molybdate transport system substrate-binding protein
LVTGAAPAADVVVMISADFYGAYAEMVPAFERASGHRVVTTRGPSMGDSPEAIPTRLARGEAADVVIMDGASADELGRRGVVRTDGKVELARSMVGMVVRAGAPKPDIGSVEAFRNTLLAAKSVAYSDSGSGTYLSTTLFAKLGLADQVLSKSRKVRGPPSGEPVAAVVARGEAEIGFQQVSELIHVPGGDLRRPDSGRAPAGGLLRGGDHQQGQAAGSRRGVDPLPRIAKAGLLELREEEYQGTSATPVYETRSVTYGNFLPIVSVERAPLPIVSALMGSVGWRWYRTTGLSVERTGNFPREVGAMLVLEQRGLADRHADDDRPETYVRRTACRVFAPQLGILLEVEPRTKGGWLDSKESRISSIRLSVQESSR